MVSTSSKYTKDKKVGEGTYANVYLGKQIKTQRDIAIKEFKPLRPVAEDGKFTSEESNRGLDISAIREIKYLQELRHENIIELVDVFAGDDRQINLVLEFLPCDMEKLIKDKLIIFMPKDIKAWMLMILRGVHHCHRSFILHRDLKTNNLLIDPNGVIKIADFGLARSILRPGEQMTNDVVTIWYKAPELLLGSRNYTPAIDIWAVGIIFAEIMMRVPYLAGMNNADQLDKTFQALGTPTETNWPNVTKLPGYSMLRQYPLPSFEDLKIRFSAAPESAIQLMNEMLHLDPSKRCTSTQALMHQYFQELPRPSKPENLPKI